MFLNLEKLKDDTVFSDFFSDTSCSLFQLGSTKRFPLLGGWDSGGLHSLSIRVWYIYLHLPDSTIKNNQM